jgi:membrane protease YdiL (CAAX protease family)
LTESPTNHWPGPSPIPEAEHEARAWGPGRAFGGLAAVIGLTLTLSAVVFMIEPPPTFDPVAVAGTSNGVLALDADANDVIRLEPRGDELEAAESIPVSEGSDFLAAAEGGNKGERTEAVAVADADSATVELNLLPAYREESAARRSDDGAVTVDAGANVRGIALSANERSFLLAIATVSGEVVLYGPDHATPRELERIDLGAIPTAVTVGDLDADGSAEVIVGAADGSVTPYSENAAGWRPGPALDLDEPVKALATGRLGAAATVAAASGDAEEVQLLEASAGTQLASGPSTDIGAEARALAIGPGGEDRADAVLAATDGGDVLALERTGADELEESSEYVPRQSLGARLAQQLILAGSLILVALAFASQAAGLTSPASLGLRPSLRSPWSVAAAAYVVYLASAIWIGFVFEPEQEDLTRELGFGESAFGDVAAAVMIIGVAAFAEELFFRGFLFGGLRRSLSWLPAAAISASIWGLFHFTGPGAAGVVVQLAIFGIVLSWVYEKTGSIWPGIALHALNNAVAFSLLTAT